MLVPCAPHLGKSFSLDNVLAIDMRSTDGIEHVIRFIVGRAIEPKLPHRVIDFLIV